MVFDIQSLRDQGYELNSALEVHIKNVGLPKDNLELNEQSTNNFKNVLFKAKETQEKLSRKVEKDAKRFKLMQKYGDILRKLETLLSLLPSSLENLSVDELTKKLEELIKTRKRNEQQIIFIFCQNLFTNTLRCVKI